VTVTRADVVATIADVAGAEPCGLDVWQAVSTAAHASPPTTAAARAPTFGICTNSAMSRAAECMVRKRFSIAGMTDPFEKRLLHVEVRFMAWPVTPQDRATDGFVA